MLLRQLRQLAARWSCGRSPRRRSRGRATGSRVVASNTSTETLERRVLLTSASVHDLTGAQSFYSAGFTGANAVAGNIEGGHLWNGHETLSRVTTLVNDTSSAGAQTGQFDRHATWVGMILGGKPTSPGNAWQQGLAPDATLMSGSMATTWSGDPYSLAFNYNPTTFITPYRTMLLTGAGAGKQTADVINSSWNSTDATAAGNGVFSRGIDALVNQSGKAVVFSAGNTGPERGTVGGPAAGYNVITVAGLAAGSETAPFQNVAAFSSRGLNDVFVPSVPDPTSIFNPQQGTIVPGVRAVIDIAAPAEDLTSALYGGATGGNSGGADPTGGARDRYTDNLWGTSFASPIVAGGLTLMADAGRSLFGGDTKALDARVSKSILQSSATKTPDWDNRQALAHDVITTRQALDAASGAGRLNLTTALDVLLNGTADLAGVQGGPVRTRGWDFGSVSAGRTSDYPIQQVLAEGSDFTATLNWFADRGITSDNTTSEVSLDDLNLEVWLARGGQPIHKVAESISQYNTVEHLHFKVPETAEYMLRVRWAGENWDLIGDADSEEYGLSWRTTGLLSGDSPVALATAPDILLAGAAPQLITVRYIDDTGITVSDIRTGNLLISGPNGFRQLAVLQSVTPETSSLLMTATYSVSPATGVWDRAAEGTYTIELRPDEVHDSAGHAVPGGILGRFVVDIADPLGPDGFGYQSVPVSHTFEDISLTGQSILTGVDDDFIRLTPAQLAGFQFPFYGRTYDSLFVSTNGLISFDRGNFSPLNTDLTDSPTQAVIAALWDDLSTAAAGAGVLWETRGTAQNQRLIIQWNRVSFLNTPGEITFQAILNAWDGSIQINYRDLEGGSAQQTEGRSATVGIRDAGAQGTMRLLAAFNQAPGLFTGTRRSLRFQQASALSLMVAPTPVVENGGTVTATVARRNADTGLPLIVRLSSNRPDLVSHPSTVTIPAGQRTASVAISLTNDDFVNSERIVQLQAEAPEFLTDMTRLIVTDDDSAGLNLVATDGTTMVSEEATRDSWTLSLTARPLTPVVVDLTISDATEAEVSPRQLVFTPENWNVAQTITVTGVDDNLHDGRQQVQLLVRVNAVASDDAFDALPAVQAVMTVLDNERPPELLGPVADTRTANPRFRWSSVADSQGYELWVSRVDSPATPVIRQTVVGTTLDSPVALELGRYRVWVRAIMGQGLYSAWSQALTFSVNTPPSVNPVTGRQAGSQPVISWKTLPGAATYEIWIDHQSTGQSAIFRRSGLTGSSVQIPVSLPLGFHRVWMRGATATGQTSAWSNPIDLEIATAPILSAPPAATLDTTPEFSWAAVTGATDFRLFVQEAASLRTVVDLRTGGRTTVSAGPLMAGKHVWWVQAIGPQGRPGLWSAAATVVIGGPPRLLTPAGRTTTSPIFEWTPVGDAATYSLAIQRTDQAGTYLQVDDLTASRLVLSSPLAAGQYRAWVRAISASGQPGLWSQPVSFQTVADAGSLDRPDAGIPELQDQQIVEVQVRRADEHENQRLITPAPQPDESAVDEQPVS